MNVKMMVARALRRLALAILAAKKKKNREEEGGQSHEVLIIDRASREYDSLLDERKDPRSQNDIKKMKSCAIKILKTFPHVGKMEGIEVRRDASKNTAMSGLIEIRTPTSIMARGFLRKLTVGSTTYWVILGLIRKKRDDVSQAYVRQINSRWDEVNKENPMETPGISIWR